MAQSFDKDQLHFIAKGAVHQQVLRTTINQALTNNKFRENFIVSSMPGLGKSFETAAAIKGLKNAPLLVEGSASIFAFSIEVATAVYLAGKNHVTIVLDDCDLLFEDKNLNIAKKMFDQTKKLIYGKNIGTMKAMVTDLQWEAIEHFSSPDKAGFQVPLNNVTFIILSNRSLPTVNEVTETPVGTKKHSNAVDLHAIRRRTAYKEIGMDNQELWGYVANVVMNEKICEKYIPKITKAKKEQILTWCYANWENLVERNLSLVEKMTKDMLKYPKDYLDIWKSEYL